VKRGQVLVGVAALALMLPTGTSAADPPQYPTVATIAGSGVPGIADGSATSAQFMMPTSVAEDSAGAIYVADFAAQRIRAIGRDGIVRTIAGGADERQYGGLWIAPGFADGPAQQARFSGPIAIALDPHGRILIADGHAIRMLADGIVTTYAGRPDEGGDRGGSRLDARFEKPVSLAVDHSGDVYVADEIDGVRKITPDGLVIPVAIPIRHPSAVALWQDAAGTTLGVADEDGLYVLPPHGNGIRIPLRYSEDNPIVQGGAPLGYPFCLAMTGPLSAVYTDVRTHTVRFIANFSTRVVAGAAYDDVENSGGGFRDAPGPDARFDGPMGILAEPSGAFVVADAGNRRIRRLSPFDERSYVSPVLPNAPFPQLDKRDYNVLVVGNSYAWLDTDWPTSIGGVLQARLERAGIGRAVRVVTLPRVSLPAADSYFHEIVHEEPVDCVILLLNSLSVVQDYPPDTLRNDAWIPLIRQRLAAIRSSVGSGTTFVAAVHPLPWEFSPTESIYARFETYAALWWLYPHPSIHEQLAATARDAGLEPLDLWPAFTRAESQPDHVPLFGTQTYHFTVEGRALVASAIADALVARKPWAR